MQRYGMVIHLKADKVDEYKRLHAAVWPGVLAALKQHNVTNYSIFFKDNLLFGYMEYIGHNYEADMKAIANDKTTQEWWILTNPCQKPLANKKPNEWWALMEEVFHMD